MFDPNSFPMCRSRNNSYFDSQYVNGVLTPVPNACFPQLDPVHNPADRTYGIPRNLLRGPGLTNLDVALAKTTTITERVKMEFRAEFFQCPEPCRVRAADLR